MLAPRVVSCLALLLVTHSAAAQDLPPIAPPSEGIPTPGAPSDPPAPPGQAPPDITPPGDTTPPSDPSPPELRPRSPEPSPPVLAPLPPSPAPTEPPSAALPPVTPPPAATTNSAPAPSSEPVPAQAEATTAAPAAKPAAPPEAEEDESDPSDGLLGPFRIGPVIGTGLPSILSFGGTIKLTRFLGGGLNVGLIPSIKLQLYGDAVLSYQEYDVYGRIYPFGGGFFLGAGFGYATIKGTIKDSVDSSALATQFPGQGIPLSIQYESRAHVRTPVVIPQLGYFHTFGSGFSLGVFAGAQIPVAPSKVEFESTVSDVPDAVVDRYILPIDQKVRSTLEKVGRSPLPTLGIQLGWLL